VVTDAKLRGEIERTGLPWRVKDKGTGIELLLVPPGKYRRGASLGDGNARAEEKPAHEVRLTQPFYLGRARGCSERGRPPPTVRRAGDASGRSLCNVQRATEET